jgi:hypothetical protein
MCKEEQRPMNGSGERAPYPARYVDGHGALDTVIRNDGKELSMTVRSVEFSGSDFDCLRPLTEPGSEKPGFFVLNKGALCSCTITCSLPIAFIVEDAERDALLSVHLELGGPSAHGGIEYENLFLSITAGDLCIDTEGPAGTFEEAFDDIAEQLGSRGMIKTCSFCVNSEYHPAGHGLFGDLACFLEARDELVNADSKCALLAIWERRTTMVQEVHVCPEFERRS